MAEQSHLINTVKAAKLQFLTSRRRPGPGPSEYLTKRYICDENIIQSGSFGQVVKYRSRRDGEVYAIKKVEVHSSELFRSTLQEVVLTSYIPHVNILKCYPKLSWLTSDDNVSTFYLVMDWCPQNLEELYKCEDMTTPCHRPTLPLTMGCITELLQAVRHLHQHGIVHADLKPSNICVTVKGMPVIIDFGLSQFEGMPPSKQYGRRSRYNPPEHFVSKKRDIWAIGVMWLEMWYLSVTETPSEDHINTLCDLLLMPCSMNDISYSNQLREFINWILNVDKNDVYCHIMCEAIVQCLSYSSVLRPSVSVLCNIFSNSKDFQMVEVVLKKFCALCNIPFHWNMIFDSWFKYQFLSNIKKSGLMKDNDVIIMMLESFMENYDFPFLGINNHIDKAEIDRLAGAYLSGLTLP